MKTVLIFGTFDILHAGHLDMFHQARTYGDRLIVVVSQDETTTAVKGAAPFHTHEERKAMLEALRPIDMVLSGSTTDRYAVIREVAPDVIALGYDQVAFTDKLEEKISEFQLHTKIVRLDPYKPTERKTSKLKAHLTML